jgi:twinkle protein
MKIKRINDVTEQLFDLHKNNTSNLLSTGFKTLDEYYQVRPSNTTIIYGYPSVGKSEFAMQLLIGLTVKYGKKHLIYTPETGTAEEIFSEIAHSLTGKTFDKRFDNYISESEIYRVQPFIQEHFAVIEDDGVNGLTLENYFELAKEVKRDRGLDCTLIDNFNDLQHTAADLASIASYLPVFLPKWNKFSKIHNLHSFMVCHARNPSGIKSGELPKAPSVFEINGGQAWYAKAQNLICVDRPYEEINGLMQQSSSVNIDVKKVKPKIVGKKGLVPLDFEFKKKCYSETVDGRILRIDTGFKTAYEVPKEIKEKVGEKIATQANFDLEGDAPF